MVSQEDKDIEFSIVSGSNEEMLFACIDSLASTMKGTRYTWSLTITSNAGGSSLPARLRAEYPEAVMDHARFGIVDDAPALLVEPSVPFGLLASDDRDFHHWSHLANSFHSHRDARAAQRVHIDDLIVRPVSR